MWKILIFELVFVCWKFKQITQKNWVWKEKNQFQSPQKCVHTWTQAITLVALKGEGVQEVSPLTPCGLIMG
jgi:hypothetical protein